MGLFDRFKKPKTEKSSQKEAGRAKKIKDQEKLRKQREAELKKRQFQAVGSTGVEAKREEKTEGKKDKSEEKKKSVRTETGIAPRVIIRPLITEKATDLGIENKYVFEVAALVNKIEVKKAVSHLYGVQPIKVSIINMRGRDVRYGRSTGSTKRWKKAVVTLKPGDKIDINT